MLSTSFGLIRPSAILLLLLSGLVLSGCEDYRGSVEGQVMTVPLSGVFQELPGDANLAFVRGPMVGSRVIFRSLKDGHQVDGYTNCEGRYFVEDVRFGPNEVFVDVEGSIDFIGPGGSICERTAVEDYFPVRPYFIDVQKDTLHELDILMQKIDDAKAIGFRVKVLDPNDVPIEDARVDVYLGAGADYIYAGTVFSNVYGIAHLYRKPDFEFAPGQNQIVDPDDPTVPGIINTDEGSIPLGTLTLVENQILPVRLELAAEGYENTTIQLYLGFSTPDQYLEVVRLTPP